MNILGQVEQFIGQRVHTTRVSKGWSSAKLA